MMAGRLNRRVTLRIPSVANVKGEQVTTWDATTKRWAEWRGAGASERFGAQQRFVEALGSYMFRSDSVTRAIDGTYELEDDGTVYEVLGAIDPDGRKREVHVFVKTPDRGVS